MALTFKAPAQELICALSALSDRTAPDGRPWCPPRDALAIRQAVIDRNEDLAALFWQLPRFVRLATLCSERAYFDLPYRAVPALRATSFKSAIEAALSRHLAARDQLEIGASGVTMLEVGMRAEGGRGYLISYPQMPRLAAFLDVLHNTLGYSTVEQNLAPVLTREGQSGSAVEAARALRTTFNAWLEPRLESAHRRQQAKIIHADLARRGVLRPDRIDDAVLYSFWSGRAEHWGKKIVDCPPEARRGLEKAARDEGFRLYRSAIAAVLVYRQALIDAATERALSEPEAEIQADLHRAGNGSDSIDAQLQASDMRNPLADLLAASSDKVKWLTDKEAELLSTCFGTQSASAQDEAIAGEDVDTTAPDAPDALARGTPVDPRFALTLMRLDVFGAAQAQIVGRMRKRIAPSVALETIIVSLPESGYQGIAAAYADVGNQLHTEAFAALDILARAGAPQFLLLADHLGGAEVRTALVNAVAGAERPHRLVGVANPALDSDLEDSELETSSARIAELGQRAAALFTAEDAVAPVRALAEQSRQSRRKVNRLGFRPQDGAVPATRAALARSTPAVLQLLADLGRLCTQLQRLAGHERFVQDRAHFGGVLKLIYAPNAPVQDGTQEA